jgi:hypothetical protein
LRTEDVSETLEVALVFSIILRRIGSARPTLPGPCTFIYLFT